jgi:hypothetical protein
MDVEVQTMKQVTLGTAADSITFGSDGSWDLGCFQVIVDGSVNKTWTVTCEDPFVLASICTDALAGISPEILGINLNGLSWQFVSRPEYSLMTYFGETSDDPTSAVEVKVEIMQQDGPITSRKGDTAQRPVRLLTFTSTVGQIQKFAIGLQEMLAAWGVS